MAIFHANVAAMSQTTIQRATFREEKILCDSEKEKQKKKKKMEPIGSVLANSYLGHDILNIPNLSPLPNSETCLPFVFMGDDAFG